MVKLSHQVSKILVRSSHQMSSSPLVSCSHDMRASQLVKSFQLDSWRFGKDTLHAAH